MSKRNAKGQGCFVDMQDGTILYRKGVGLNAFGKRKVLTVRAASKAACLRLMKEKEEEWLREKERINPAESNTVVELCEKHLYFQTQNGELKPKSVDRREVTINHQIGKYPLGYLQVQAVTPADIEAHIGTLMKENLSASSIKKALDVLNAAYEWAVIRGDLKSNPVSQIRRSIAKRLSKLENKEAAQADVVVMSEEEQEHFLKETLVRNNNNGCYKYAGGLYGRLLLHTGMRVGEMISLRWADYDEENGLLTICKSTSMSKNRDSPDKDQKYIAIQGSTKNQKARVIQLNPEAVEDLEMIREYKPGGEKDLICRTRTGKPYTASMLEHCMETIYRKLTLDTQISGLHIFRRTFATRMYEIGADVKEIAAYIGDLESTTMRYYIAARKKVKIGDNVSQIVPLPGKRKVPTKGEDK